MHSLVNIHRKQNTHGICNYVFDMLVYEISALFRMLLITDSMYMFQLLVAMGLRTQADVDERVKIGKLLYQHGADLTVTNTAGQTPLTGCRVVPIRTSLEEYAATK